MSRGNAVAEYVLAPTGTIHLVWQRTAHFERTLCGRKITGAWVQGDETISGIAATCGSCRTNLTTPRR